MMDFFVEHWPFFTAAISLWVIGHFMETSIWTKARVWEHSPEHHGKPPRVKGQPKPEWKDPRSGGEKFHHWVFYWMRESMELHPMVAGFVIGLIWRNPELADPAWHWAMNCGYFVLAGVMSLGGWLFVTKGLEKLGIKGQFRMPGESLRPPAKGDEK